MLKICKSHNKVCYYANEQNECSMPSCVVDDNAAKVVEEYEDERKRFEAFVKDVSGTPPKKMKHSVRRGDRYATITYWFGEKYTYRVPTVDISSLTDAQAIEKYRRIAMVCFNDKKSRQLV